MMDMKEVPDHRCGFTYPDDVDEGKETKQNTCIREPLPDNSRCKWHSEPSKTEYKTDKLSETDSITGSLDGIILDEDASEAIELNSDMSFSNKFIRNSNLSKTDLSKTDLSGVNLYCADLSDADLHEADLSNADLEKATLSEARLWKSDLSNSVTINADFSGGNINNADLSEANLSEADLSEAKLSEADLSEANLSEADLSEANLSEADLSEADMRRGDLSETTIKKSDLSRAMLQNANFKKGDLKESNLSESKIFETNLTKTDLRHAKIAKKQLIDCITEDTFVTSNSVSNLPDTGSSLEGVIIIEPVDDNSSSRCGHTSFSEDHILTSDITHQSTCYLPTVDTGDKCIWHIDPDKLSYSKTADKLSQTLFPKDKKQVEEERTPSRESIYSAQDCGQLLDGAILSNAELRDEFDFEYLSLRRASLQRTDLSNVKIKNSDFSEANLSETKLTGSNIENTNFSEASLASVDFSNANIDNTDFSESDLRKADFSNVYLKHSNLKNINIGGANISESHFYEVDLSEAWIGKSNLSKVVIRKSELSDCDLISSNLTESDFRDVDFSNASLQESDLSDSDLEDTHLSDVDLSEASLNSADCENTDFRGANLNRATLENADLTGADLSDTYLYQTRLTGAQINETTKFFDETYITDTDTANACRYDSDIQKQDPNEALEDDVIINNNKNPEEARARRARSTYSRLEALARENGFPELKSEMFIRRQEARRELLFAKGQWVKGSFAQVQKWLFNYGESFSRIIGISAVTIIIWWLLYMVGGIVEDESGIVINSQAITDDPLLVYQTLLHSIYVFSSGNQVLAPANLIGEGLIIMEAAIGPLLVALLIFVLGRRAAR